ncbi:MAG: short-chain dehydrogenase, partial [Alphaproteobacteria bacterium]|nr:short-chain dehydrogenase [Alphaproteobacteria bacterium]
YVPHAMESVVTPGHIGTNIVINSGKVLGKPDPMDMTADDVAKLRDQMTRRGKPVGNLPDNAIRGAIKKRGEDFRDKAPTTPVQAAAIILDGAREDRWRILVGEDAQALDHQVRARPEDAYEAEFMQGLHDDGYLNFTLDR